MLFCSGIGRRARRRFDSSAARCSAKCVSSCGGGARWYSFPRSAVSRCPTPVAGGCRNASAHLFQTFQSFESFCKHLRGEYFFFFISRAVAHRRRALVFGVTLSRECVLPGAALPARWTRLFFLCESRRTIDTSCVKARPPLYFIPFFFQHAKPRSCATFSYGVSFSAPGEARASVGG